MKSEVYKKMIKRQMERNEQYLRDHTVKKPPIRKEKKIEEHPVSSEAQALKEEIEHIDSGGVGLHNKGYRRFKSVEGIKFVPEPLDKMYVPKNTGVRCRHPNCKMLTERVDGFCMRHSNHVSKSIKYKVAVPKNVKHQMPTLEEFKDKLSEK